MATERRSKPRRRLPAPKPKVRPQADPEPDWSSGLKSTTELPDFTDAELNRLEKIGEVDEHLEALFEQEPGRLKRAGDQVVEVFRSVRADDEEDSDGDEPAAEADQPPEPPSNL